MNQGTALRRLVGVFGIAIVGLGACGGGSSSDVVIRVAGKPISKATVDHWLKVEAVISNELIPRRPPPKGLVPDPPAYTDCIAYQRTHGLALPKGSAAQVTAALKGQCRKRYESVRQHVLQLLVTFQWLIGEGARHGVKVSAGEVRQALARFRRENFTSDAAFEHYFTYTGETPADQSLVLKIDLLVAKLQHRITAQGGAAALAKFSKELTSRWVARTSCRRGYVVPDCKQYNGPLPPEAAT